MDPVVCHVAPEVGHGFVGADEASEAPEDWDPLHEIVEAFGENWMEEQHIKMSSKTYCPGLEEGWLVCDICHKQLAGYWTVLTHCKSRRHQANLEWLSRPQGPQGLVQLPAPVATAPPRSVTWTQPYGLTNFVPPPPPDDAPASGVPPPPPPSVNGPSWAPPLPSAPLPVTPAASAAFASGPPAAAADSCDREPSYFGGPPSTVAVAGEGPPPPPGPPPAAVVGDGPPPPSFAPPPGLNDDGPPPPPRSSSPARAPNQEHCAPVVFEAALSFGGAPPSAARAGTSFSGSPPPPALSAARAGTSSSGPPPPPAGPAGDSPCSGPPPPPPPPGPEANSPCPGPPPPPTRAGSRLAPSPQGPPPAAAPPAPATSVGSASLLPSTQGTFSAHEVVEAHGLASAAGQRLNGQHGTVLRLMEASGRYEVQFDSGQVVSLTPQNLRKVVAATSEAVGTVAAAASGTATLGLECAHDGWELDQAASAAAAAGNADGAVASGVGGASIVACAYDGREIDEAGRPEGGYVGLAAGDVVELWSAASPGHGANQWPSYAYGRSCHGEEGWIPVGCLQTAE